MTTASLASQYKAAKALKKTLLRTVCCSLYCDWNKDTLWFISASIAALWIFVAACSRNASFRYLVTGLLLNTSALFWVLWVLCFWQKKQKTPWFSENSNHQIHVVLQHARSFSSSQADASSSSLITSVWPLLLHKPLFSFYVCNYRNYGGCPTPIVLYQQTSLYLVLPSTLQFLAH